MDSTACCCVDLYQLPITRYLLGDSFHPGGLKLTAQLATQLLLSRDSRVLDVASGIGTTSLYLAEHFGCGVVALDLAAENLKTTADNATRLNLNNTLHTVQASADKLPFDDNTFDAIICECALCTFEKPLRSVKEMHRVLRPGGRIAISDVYLNAPIPEQLDTLLGRAFCISGARSIDSYVCLLNEAGFSRVSYKNADWAISEMLQHIEKQAALLAKLDKHEYLSLPNWLQEKSSLIDALKQFIDLGGLGYFYMSARK